MTRISFLGAGYVGLITAVCFADRGFDVTVADPDISRVKSILRGEAPFYEAGLQELLKKAISRDKFRCIAKTGEAVLESEISFITVGTPSSEKGQIDLKYVEICAKEVGVALRKKIGYHLVVVKSTVIPGTTMGLVRGALEAESGKVAGRDFGLCFNPEFLAEGAAVRDTFNPDRVVIGGIDGRSSELLEKVFREFYGANCPPIVKTTPSSAEMIKYASNSILAAKVSLINEIANVCELTPNVDVSVVARGVGLDKRIGERFLKAGAGFGGSCFKKDVQALTFYAQALGYKPILLRDILRVNEQQARHIVDLAKNALGSLAEKRVVILGLSFKPNTDDMREAPSIKIIQRLLKEKALVVAYDPEANRNTRAIFGNRIKYAPYAKDALKDADCCILVTEWEEFKKLEPRDFLEAMRNPLLVDGRRLYDCERYRENLKYIGVGLGPLRE